MPEMILQVKTIKGFNCPRKTILMVDGNPILVGNSPKGINNALLYIQGWIDTLDSEKMERFLNKYRELWEENKYK